MSNFISTNKKEVINSYGDLYSVGEVVAHESKDSGVATIVSFELIELENEIRAHTTKGYCRIDYLVKVPR